MKPTRLSLAAVLSATALAAAGGGVASAHRHGDDHGSARARLFTLTPDPAANPEGVAADHKAFYVSSTGDGAIYRGTLRSPTVVPYIPGAAGQSAVGLKVRHHKLYVAGGSTGAIKVYDLRSKQLLATFDTGSGGFLNDLVVTSHGDVYVTDSNRPMLWHVTRDQVKAGSGTPQGLDVSAGIPFQTGFNLNGIVAKSSHKLVVVQTNTGKLFRIDLNDDGDAIDGIDEVQGVSVPGGDGLLLDRGRLIVVQGGPPAQLSLVKLSHGARRGELRDTRTSPLLKGPSTIARLRDLYLVVNADFATSTKPFTVAGLPVKERAAKKHDGDDDHGQANGDDDHGQANGDDDGPGHDAGDDNGHAAATPTPYYGGAQGGDDNGSGGNATATPTPYYGGAQGGDDNGSGGSHGGGSGGGGHGHG
jgi:sugar lactone lactonase YvrE